MTGGGTFQAVLRGDLAAWQGLPAGLTPEALGAELGAGAELLTAEPARRASHRFSVTGVARPEAPRHLEAWVPVGATDVAIVDIADPTVADLEGTLSRLGPPELLLTDRRFDRDAQVREWVYARRGVTLSIAEPFEVRAGEGRRLVHLELFPATTPEVYLTEIDRGRELSPATHPRPV